jgi:hypothetical protein
MNPFIVLSMLMFDGISGRPVSAGNTPGGRRCGMGWFISLHHDCDFCFGQAVTAKLEGGADIVLDVHGRAPGFEEKLSRAADAKTVIRRLGAVGGFVGVCVDYILVGFSAALLVINIPAEGFEERVKEFTANLGFVVMAGLVSLAVALKAFHQIENGFGNGRLFVARPGSN